MWLPLLLIGAALAVPEGETTEAIPEPEGSVAQAESAPRTEEIRAEPLEMAEPLNVQVNTEEAPPTSETKVETGGKGLSAQLSTGGGDGRIWHLRGDVQYRQLAITDATPINDLWMVYRLRADLDVFPHARAFIWGGMRQQFWAEPGETGWFPQDLQLGLNYTQEVKLDFVPLDFFKSKKVELVHLGRVYLPTSRSSSNQDLYLAPEELSRASFGVTDELTLVGEGYFQYRMTRYAEQAGLEGGMLPVLDFGPSVGLEYTVLDRPTIGTITVGADASTYWNLLYPSREAFASSISDQYHWVQGYGWDAYASYTPWEYTTLVVMLNQGGPVVRSGIVHMYLAKREETELFIWAIAHY
jgi:hypothetical protein